MKPDLLTPTAPGKRQPRDKPFPWYCPRCRQKVVRPTRIAHRSEILFDDGPHTVEIPQLEVPRCENCGELLFDNHAEHQIYQAFRAQLHLLQPEQIRANRESLGLSEKQLAELLGVAEEMVSQWEDGRRIQSRMEDNFLRIYFTAPEARTQLANLRHDPSLGVFVVQRAGGEPQPPVSRAVGDALVPDAASPR